MKLLNKDEFLANEIKYYFLKKNYKEGDKLPSERELSEMFGSQRTTIRNAYSMLEEEGLIEIRDRSGRYMSHPRLRNNLFEIMSFSSMASNAGIVIKNKLYSFEVLEADKKLSKKMMLQLGTVVYKVARVRKVVREDFELPIAIEHSYIPEEQAPQLIRYNLEENSLFKILEDKYGKKPLRDIQNLEIVYATEFEAELLKVDLTTPLLRKYGITYDKDDNILQYINSVLNKDWVEFESVDSKIRKEIGEMENGL